MSSSRHSRNWPMSRQRLDVEQSLFDAGVVPVQSMTFLYDDSQWVEQGFEAVMDFCERRGADRHDVGVYYFEVQGPMDEPVPAVQVVWRA